MYFKLFRGHDGITFNYPNFHHLVHHLCDQMRYLGPLWSNSTRPDECFHQKIIKAIKHQNGWDHSRDSISVVYHFIQTICFAFVMYFHII